MQLRPGCAARETGPLQVRPRRPTTAAPIRDCGPVAAALMRGARLTRRSAAAAPMHSGQRPQGPPLAVGRRRSPGLRASAATNASVQQRLRFMLMADDREILLHFTSFTRRLSCSALSTVHSILLLQLATEFVRCGFTKRGVITLLNYVILALKPNSSSLD
jgi:hypothetical protein